MHAQSLITSAAAARPPAPVRPCAEVDPLRAGRFGWIALDTWTVRDNQAGGDVACMLLTAAGRPGDPAEQAMPALAEVVGLDPRPGTHTLRPDAVSVTLDQRWITLHVGTDWTLRRPVTPQWHQLAQRRGWVRIVIGYRARAADADGVEDLDHALAGQGVTADVPIRGQR